MEQQQKKVQNVQSQTIQCVVCKEKGGDMMHGKCYYERFEKEIDEMDMEPPIVDGAYLEAAKRASGIE